MTKLEDILKIIAKEPNYETFEYKGYKCLIKRNMLGGQLNGYVGLPEGHKFYGKGYDDIPINAHGGLTFSGKWEDENDNLWYIGFDTAHYMDYQPMLQMQLSNRTIMDNGTYKDINYVRQECKNIVDQLS